jgi:hypothetical protein
VGNGRKVLNHYIKTLKESGYPPKAADAQFSDFSDRELDAMFDLTIEEFDKIVEDSYNEESDGSNSPMEGGGEGVRTEKVAFLSVVRRCGQIGEFGIDAEDLQDIVQDALEKSDGGEKAPPLGIPNDYNGNEDVMLMTGYIFNNAVTKLKLGGAAYGKNKLFFLTQANKDKYEQVSAPKIFKLNIIS